MYSVGTYFGGWVAASTTHVIPSSSAATCTFDVYSSWELDQLSYWRSHTAWERDEAARLNDNFLFHRLSLSVLDLHQYRLWYTTHKPMQVPLIPSNPSNPSIPWATENCQKEHKDCKRRGEYDRRGEMASNVVYASFQICQLEQWELEHRCRACQ
ncbi:hypothetical protein EDB84DRAFT_515739 [Lactarius hengduanensis]|nr:hypothetical protein EDB84DRAFT_515739 [Lactarius hengduanensis]